MNVLYAFKETYEDHKAKLHSYFTDNREPVEWEFTPKLVFPRFDKFTDRLEMIIVSQEIGKTIQEFSNANIIFSYFYMNLYLIDGQPP